MKIPFLPACIHYLWRCGQGHTQSTRYARGAGSCLHRRSCGHQDDTGSLREESADGFRGADPRQSRTATGPPVQLNHRNAPEYAYVEVKIGLDRVLVGLRVGLVEKVGKRRQVFWVVRVNSGKIPALMG